MSSKPTPGAVGEPFWMRTLSRRNFVRTAAGAAGARVLLGAGLSIPAWAGDDEDDKGRCVTPLPIPQVTNGHHFFFPGPVTGEATPTDPKGAHPGGRDPSVITHLDGFIGQVDLNFGGMGTNTKTGASATFNFHTDTRFVKGVFIGADERRHRGAFAFI